MDPPDAHSIFREFKERAARGEAVDIERVCSKHPTFADELRHLHADWILDGMARDGDATLSTFASPAGTAGWSSLLDGITKRVAKWMRYEIRGEFARGGMGSLLSVFDKDLLRTLAMKVIRPDAYETNPGGRSTPANDRTLGRFLEEAQVSSQLDHPGIVPVHDLGLDAEGRVFFTMKLVRGEDLRTIFDKVMHGIEGWSVTRALSILLRVCEAMAYAHMKGVIHRDLKPGNVMVGRFNEVYVMDWGLARIVGDPKKSGPATVPRRPDEESVYVRSDRKQHIAATPGSPLVTLDGDIVGTPAYMPPEQALGKLDEVGPASDVYSVGAILYELLAGHMPYVRPGDQMTPRTILTLVLEEPPHSLSLEATAAPAELIAICEKAMARDRANRYPEMGALADDLRAFLEHRVVGAYEVGAIAELKKWVSRNKTFAATFAAALLATIALGGWAFHERRLAKANATAATLAAAHADATAKKADAAARAAAISAADAASRTTESLARKAEFDQLAAATRLDEALAKAENLYPPWPENVAAMEEWLERDHARLVEIAPSISETIAELKGRAQPRPVGEIDPNERLPRRFDDLERRGKVADWLRRTEPVRRGEVKPQDVDLPAELATWSAAELLVYARNRFDIDESNRIFGEEPLALAAARAALAKIDAGDTSAYRSDSCLELAWAFVANGRDSEVTALIEGVRSDPDPAAKARTGVLLQWLDDALEYRASEVWREYAKSTIEQYDVLAAEADWIRSHRFTDDSQGFLYDTLSDTRSRIDALEVDVVPSVQQRLEWAKQIGECTLHHPRATATWEEARAAITRADDVTASSLYKNVPIDLKPQMGLVPIGMNPRTKLWEFYDLRSAGALDTQVDPAKLEIPAHHDDGSIDVGDETGIVFVLLPGASVVVGAQRGDPHAPNFDPEAGDQESSPATVVLAPFLISRYELTIGQSMRLDADDDLGGNRLGSTYGNEAAIGLHHPVEYVSWQDCESIGRRAGFELPTQAQWEYAARGGTDTPFWTGRDPAALLDTENLTGSNRIANSIETNPTLRSTGDRFEGPAPVGSLRPNPFGLYDVLGNVGEWCSDGVGPLPVTAVPGMDGRRFDEARDSEIHAMRGGGFQNGPSDARVTFGGVSSYSRNQGLGFRAMRRLRP